MSYLQHWLWRLLCQGSYGHVVTSCKLHACKLDCHLRIGTIIMVFCVSTLVVKSLGFGIEQVRLNEPALPKKHDNYSQSSNELLWLSKGPPGSFQPPPPWPLAGWTQDPGTCGFNSWECSWEHCGNLRFMPCKKSGSMKSSWELFLSAVWSHLNQFLFPGTFCNVPRNLFKIPRNGSWECFFMCPGGGIQAGTMDGTC